MPWESVASALMPSLMLPGCAHPGRREATTGPSPMAPPAPCPPERMLSPLSRLAAPYLHLLPDTFVIRGAGPRVQAACCWITLPCSALRSQPHLKLGRSLMR